MSTMTASLSRSLSKVSGNVSRKKTSKKSMFSDAKVLPKSVAKAKQQGIVNKQGSVARFRRHSLFSSSVLLGKFRQAGSCKLTKKNLLCFVPLTVIFRCFFPFHFFSSLVFSAKEIDHQQGDQNEPPDFKIFGRGV